MNAPDDFFIGWAGRLPRDHRLAVIGRLAIGALLLAMAFLLGHRLDDAGPGGFDPGGDVTLRGVLTLDPSPVLFVAPDAGHPNGHSLLLSGDGKRGPTLDRAWDGQVMAATGPIIRRGALEMLLVDRIAPLPGLDLPKPPEVELGRWRIEGEICDGKCAAGAMRPGRGLAHRACAILCLNGALPPVFVTTGPIDGQEFLLLAGETDDMAWTDLVGLLVRLDGRVTRHGDMLIFRADLAHAVVVR